jgi:PLP dependent protein
VSAVTSPSDAARFAERLATVRSRIASAAEAAGRSPADVTLIGVTKTHPPALAQLAVSAGLVDLGENRVQELLAKQPRVTGARWHLIGRLQRRKARDVVGRHVLVHTLDRPELADALSRRAAAAGVVQRVLVQVNVGEDPAKGGCHLTEAAELVAYARDLPNLAVEGLMTMPPLPPEGVDHATAARPLFAALRAERDRLRDRFPEVVHLSMGMTADLEAAVAEGATMVRVGTALFGPRGEGPWRPEDER